MPCPLLDLGMAVPVYHSFIYLTWIIKALSQVSNIVLKTQLFPIASTKFDGEKKT